MNNLSETLVTDDQGIKRDKFGQMIFTCDQISDCLLINPRLKIQDFYVFEHREYSKSVHELLTGFDIPKIYDISELEKSQVEVDNQYQNHWLVPGDYINLDILTWLLNQAPDQLAKDRVLLEYALYEKYKLIDFLRFLKYMTDVLKANNIIQGVGRGSSVSSYCLFLMGVHKINPLRYDLDITEFLR
jgi:DNA polymerase III alpha subunit